MFGREIEDMPMAWIAETLRRWAPVFNCLGSKGTWHHWATKRRMARLQWVFKLSIIPVISWHWWQALIHMLEMSIKGRRLPRGPQVQAMCPVTQPRELSNTRVPWRMSRVHVARACQVEPVWWALCAPALACRFFHARQMIKWPC